MGAGASAFPQAQLEARPRVPRVIPALSRSFGFAPSRGTRLTTQEVPHEVRTSGALRAAIYARVSSERQAHEDTIDSQVQALRRRVQEEGLTLDEELCFLDDGYSGSTLVRPALERLRDQAAAGAVDRLYVHSPDRLARRYAYQALLVDELQHCGVELVFLNRPLGKGAGGRPAAAGPGHRRRVRARQDPGALRVAASCTRPGAAASASWRMPRTATAMSARGWRAARHASRCVWPRPRSCATSSAGWPASD